MSYTALTQTIAGKIGGIDSTQSNQTINIVGGFNSKLQITEHKIVIGSQSKFFVKSKIIEWETFKDTYLNKKKLDIKFYDKLVEEINTIIPFPTYVNKPDDLSRVLIDIYQADIHSIINGISKHLNMFNPIELTIKHFFMSWKVFIEKQIELFVHLRNNYIESKKLTGGTNDFSKLVEHWNNVSNENNLQTSSIIILFNFPGNGMLIEKTVPKIDWRIKNDPINKDINKFLDLITTRKFGYVGFCHYKPIERLLLLLKFPIHALCEINKKLDIDSKFNNIYILPKKECKQIQCMETKLNSLNYTKFKPDIFPKPPKPLNIYTNQNNNINFFMEYMEKYMQMYKILLPCLIKKEELINDLAICINLIANDIQNLIKKIKIPEYR
jgi:hypothetical protein